MLAGTEFLCYIRKLIRKRQTKESTPSYVIESSWADFIVVAFHKLNFYPAEIRGGS